MAQKREKEETELKVPESPPPHLLATDSTRSTEISDPILLGSISPEIIDPKLSGADQSRSASATSPVPEISRSVLKLLDPKLSGETRSTSATTPEIVDRKAAVKRPREENRCSGIGCRRKVGLMPFRCRCGEVFCSEHRYSDRHDCGYDYKAAGREAIARENPVVKAAKIIKV